MATKKKQSKLRKFIGIFNPTTRKGYMALFVLLFAIFGGGYMLYQSFAASAPVYRTDYLSWGYSISTRTTPNVLADGVQLCVATNFDTYDSPFWDNDYKFMIDGYIGSKWTQVFASKYMGANGNRDHVCYGVKRGTTYRVRFSGGPHEHGTYWIWGHYHS